MKMFSVWIGTVKLSSMSTAQLNVLDEKNGSVLRALVSIPVLERRISKNKIQFQEKSRMRSIK